jgi:hypothetical protein
MSSVVISGDTSGAITVSAPAVSGTNTLTLQAATATSAVNTLGTAVASTSGTSIDFTGLPSWVKRITVMAAGVSTSGTSTVVLQLGSGSVQSTGYVGMVQGFSGSAVGAVTSSTSNFSTEYSTASAASLRHGTYVFTLITGNTWVMSSNIQMTGSGGLGGLATGYVALSGALDRVRITTANGTDTFDAGTINILYEG